MWDDVRVKLIRKATEAEMILEFLKGELNSKRFNVELNHVILELNLSTSIILDGDITKSFISMYKFKNWSLKQYSLGSTSIDSISL